MPLPTPRTWADGEEPENIPTADDLNYEWRDSFDFLLGVNRPMIYVHSSTTQNLTANVFSTINWQVELLKRGDITHAANSSDMVVPYTGQYLGFMMIGLVTFSTVATRVVGQVMQNGVNALNRIDISPQSTGGMELQGSFTLNLTAGDAISTRVRTSVGTVSTSTSLLGRPRFAMWYVGDYS